MAELQTRGWVDRMIINELTDRGENKRSTHEWPTGRFFTAYWATKGELNESGKVTVRRSLSKLRDRELIEKIETEGKTAKWRLTETGINEGQSLKESLHEEVEETAHRFGFPSERLSLPAYAIFQPIVDIVESVPEYVVRGYEYPGSGIWIKYGGFPEPGTVEIDYQEGEFHVGPVVSEDVRNEWYNEDLWPETTKNPHIASELVQFILKLYTRTIMYNDFRRWVGDESPMPEPTAERFLDRFETFEEVIEAEKDEFKEVQGVGRKTAERVVSYRESKRELWEKAVDISVDDEWVFRHEPPECPDCGQDLFYNSDKNRGECPWCND